MSTPDLPTLPRLRVLVVDDELIVTRLLTRQLTEAGLDVVAFTRSEAAVAAFADDPHAFDLAVLDRLIPSISGPRVAYLLWQLRPSLPVVFVSAMIEEIRLHAPAGPHRRLAKPYRAHDLLHAIHELVDTVPSPGDPGS